MSGLTVDEDSLQVFHGEFGVGMCLQLATLKPLCSIDEELVAETGVRIKPVQACRGTSRWSDQNIHLMGHV